MSDRDHLNQALESVLHELCKQQGKTRSLQGLYQDDLQSLKAEEFPADVQPKFDHLMDQMNQMFGNQTPSENPIDPPSARQASIIRELIGLFACLQTHKTPYVDKHRFLKRFKNSSPNSIETSSPSERKPTPTKSVARAE